MFSSRCSQLLQLSFRGLHVIQLEALEYCQGLIGVLYETRRKFTLTMTYFGILLWFDRNGPGAGFFWSALPWGMSSMRIYHNTAQGFWSSPAMSRTFCTSCSQSGWNWKSNWILNQLKNLKLNFNRRTWTSIRVKFRATYHGAGKSSSPISPSSTSIPSSFSSVCYKTWYWQLQQNWNLKIKFKKHAKLAYVNTLPSVQEYFLVHFCWIPWCCPGWTGSVDWDLE